MFHGNGLGAEAVFQSLALASGELLQGEQRRCGPVDKAADQVGLPCFGPVFRDQEGWKPVGRQLIRLFFRRLFQQSTAIGLAMHPVADNIEAG